MSQAALANPFALRCTLDYPDVDAFVSRYGRNLSGRGIFLPAREPPAVGTAVRFEVTLVSGRSLLRGEGVVVGRMPLDPVHPEQLHGMALRFLRLDADSRALLDRVAAHKAAHPSEFYEPAPDLFDRPLAAPVEEPKDESSAAPSPVAAPPTPLPTVPPSAVSGPEEAELLALRTPPSIPASLAPREAARRLEALLSRRR